MNNSHNRSIPTRADDPIPILMWEPVEFICAIALLGIFIAMNLWIVGIVLCSMTLWVSNEMKKGAKRGAAQHAIWSIGLNLDRVLPHKFPPAWLNEFIE